MKQTYLRTVPALLALAALTVLLGQQSFAEKKTSAKAHGPIAWMDSLQKARVRAKQEKKPLMVDFYAEWCGPCQQMLKTTYRDKAVVTRTAKFIPVLINVDKQPQVAEEYGIQSIPTVLFLNADGQVLRREVGYHNAKEFSRIMESIQK